MTGAVVRRFRGYTPQVGEGAFLAELAALIGDVVIGPRSSIWFGTVVRGDVMPIRIGAETSIQDNSVVHVTGGVAGTIVGDRCTVGHRVILHACTVEDDCLIGMGAIVLDGAVIGRGSIIGAGSVVTPGTIIPPGSLALGAPARVKRAVTEEERARNAASAAHYVELSHAYLAG
jgi:gamma-carbonic anhydrase